MARAVNNSGQASESLGFLGRVSKALTGADILTSVAAADYSKMGASAASKHAEGVKDAVESSSGRIRDALGSTLKSLNRDYDEFMANRRHQLTKQIGNIYDFDKKQWGFTKTVWFNLLKNTAETMKKGISTIGNFVSGTFRKIGGFWSWLLEAAKKMADFLSTNVYEFLKKKIQELKALMLSIPGATQALEVFKQIRQAVYETGRSIGASSRAVQDTTREFIAMGTALIPAQRYVDAYIAATQVGARGALTEAAQQNLAMVSQATGTSMDILTGFYFQRQRMGETDEEIVAELNRIYLWHQNMLSSGAEYGSSYEQTIQALTSNISQTNLLMAMGGEEQARAFNDAIVLMTGYEQMTGIQGLTATFVSTLTDETNRFGQMLGGPAGAMRLFQEQGLSGYWDTLLNRFGGISGILSDTSPQNVFMLQEALKEAGFGDISVAQASKLREMLVQLSMAEMALANASHDSSLGLNSFQVSLEGNQTPAQLLEQTLQTLGSTIKIGDFKLGEWLEGLERFETVFEQAQGGLEFLSNSMDFFFGPLSAILKPLMALATIFMTLGTFQQETNGGMAITDRMLEELGPLGSAFLLIRKQGDGFKQLFENLKVFFLDFMTSLFSPGANGEESAFTRLINTGISFLTSEETMDSIIWAVENFITPFTQGLQSMFEALQNNPDFITGIETMFKIFCEILTTVVSEVTPLLVSALSTLVNVFTDVFLDTGVAGKLLELAVIMISAMADLFGTLGTVLYEGILLSINPDSPAAKILGLDMEQSVTRQENLHRTLVAEGLRASMAPGDRSIEEIYNDLKHEYDSATRTNIANPATWFANNSFMSRENFELSVKAYQEGFIDEYLQPIRARAGGGLITHPEISLVGEAGPEVISPLSTFLDYSTALVLRTSKSWSKNAFGVYAGFLKDDRQFKEYIIERLEYQLELEKQFNTGFTRNAAPVTAVANMVQPGIGAGNYTQDQILNAIMATESGGQNLNNGLAAGRYQSTVAAWNESAAILRSAGFDVPNVSSLAEILTMSADIQRLVANAEFTRRLENFLSTETPLEFAFASYNGGVGWAGDSNNFYQRANDLLGSPMAWISRGGWGTETVTYVLRNLYMLAHPDATSWPDNDTLYQTYLNWPRMPRPSDFGVAEYADSVSSNVAYTPFAGFAEKGGTIVKQSIVVAGEKEPEEIVPYSKLDAVTKLLAQSQNEFSDEVIQAYKEGIYRLVDKFKEIDNAIRDNKVYQKA